jgi:hypothetical protein
MLTYADAGNLDEYWDLIRSQKVLQVLEYLRLVLEYLRLVLDYPKA